jgi:uncharacterized protein
MRIELDKLAETGGKFEHSYEPDELILDDENARLLQSPQIAGRVRRSGQEVRVSGRLTASAEVDCDRCLKAVALPIETSFDVTYVPASSYQESQTAELQADDLVQSVYEDEVIDVDELVREQILLALPVRALCSEECHGLCPICGSDKNLNECACQSATIDPRWSALAELKQNRE